MLRRLARSLVLSLPPSLVRRAQALGQDLRGLPARLRDPERRSDPWAVVHNVGAGDWRAVGDAVFERLLADGGLRPDSRVVDVGCGDGRVARPLAAFLSPQGGYVGFDVSRPAVEASRRRFRETRPDFRFDWADVASAHYAPGGREAAGGYRFSVEDGWADLVFATSVLTHTDQTVLRRYLAEAARVLKPSGRLLFTAYLWTPERAEAIARREARVRPRFPWRGSWVVHPRDPESAVAHPEPAVLDAVSAAGLALERVRRGTWAPPSDYGDLQDLVTAVRA